MASRRVRLAAGVAVAAVGLWAPPAGADPNYSEERRDSYTFTSRGGVEVTCDVFSFFNVQFDPDDSERVVDAYVLTRASGPEPCRTGTATAVATYDVDGVSQRYLAQGGGSEASLDLPGGIEWRTLGTEHTVHFPACGCGTPPYRLGAK